MNSVRAGNAVLFAVLVLAGCGGGRLEAYDRYRLGPARDTIAASVESMGGLEAWKKVGSIRAEALMTIYDDQGQMYVNRQKHVIDIHGRRITASATTARKRWTATYTGGGKGHFSLRGADALDIMTPDKLREALAIILHRVGGPLNLLGRKEHVGGVTKVSVDGRNYLRVAVEGDKAMATAYYFDAADASLAMVSAGRAQPGQDGTVTLYEYQMLPNGMVFPARIRLVRVGQFVLVGQKPLMEVRFSNVRID